MSWDEVCSKFETLNLNWDPDLLPVTAEKHWCVHLTRTRGTTDKKVVAEA